MEIAFHCEKCGQKIVVDEAEAGTEIRCPSCQGTVLVPRQKLRLKKQEEPIATHQPANPAGVAEPARQCPQCGKPIAEAALFCVQCGWDSRTTRPAKASPQKQTVGSAAGPTVRQWIVGAAAVVVLIICGFSIHATLSNSPSQSPSLWTRFRSRLPHSLPRGDDITILDWRLSAVPTLQKMDAPTFVAPQRAMGQSYATGGDGRSRNQKKPAVIREVSAVRIDLGFDLASTGQSLGLFPKVTDVRLLRAASSNAAFKVVGSWGEQELQPLGAVTPPNPPPPGNHSKGTRGSQQFSLVDTTVEAGAMLYYKVQLFHRRKSIAESGVCSTLAIQLPEVAVNVDHDGFPHMKWTGPASIRGRLVTEPHILISLAWAHPFARFPLEAGEFQAPLKVSSPVGQQPQYALTVEARARTEVWGLKEGQRTTTVLVSLQKPLDVPLPTGGNGPWGQRESILVEPYGSGDWANSSYGVPPDTGVNCVVWKMPTDGRGTRTVEINSPSLGGPHPFLQRRGSDELTCAPGLSERLEMVFQFTTNKNESVRSAHVSMVRNPLPTGLVAAPSDGQVKLTWDKIAFDPRDWAEGPQFVLRRCDESQASTQDNRLQAAPTEEVSRCEANVTEFTDTHVRNGTVYFYSLSVEGMTRATSWSANVGEYPHLLPVHVRMPLGFSGYPVIAMPAKKRPLRVSLLAEAAADTRVNSAQAHFLHALRDINWIELVERDVAPSLLDETQLKGLRSGDAADAENFKRAMTADLILRCRGRQAGHASYLDVWMEDLKNSRRERLFTAPLDDLDLEQAAGSLLQAVTERFAGYAGAVPAKKVSGCALVRTIVLAGFLPVSKTTLSEGGVEDVLTAALTSDECLKVVDRTQIDKIMQEMGVTRITDQTSAIQLGKLLHADAIVTGFYGYEGKQITISARLVDVETANLIKIIDLAGPFASLSELGKQLALEISTASKLEKQPSDSPLLRWLESKTYSGGEDKLKEVKTAAYLSPETPGHHFDIGHEYEKKGQLEDALASFYNGMNLAEKREDPWRFYSAAGAVLRTLNRPEEESQLWKRAVADREKRGLEMDTANFNLARCLREMGRRDEAIATLKKLRLPCYELGQLYEETGRRKEALQVYETSLTATAQNRPRGGSLTPSYAAVIRLLDGASREEQAELLKALVDNLTSVRPYQARKAMERFRGVSTQAAILSVSAAELELQNGEEEEARRILGQITKNQPNSLEAMKAWDRLAGLYRRAGDNQKAKECWEQVVRQKVKSPQADAIRGQAEMRLKGNSPVSVPKQPAKEIKSCNDKIPKGWSARQTGPIVNDRNYWVSDTGVLFCVDLRTGAVLWCYELRPHEPFRKPPEHGGGWGDASIPDSQQVSQMIVVDTNTVFVTNPIDAALHAVDKRSGQLRWVYMDWTTLSRPIVTQDRVCVGNAFGELVVLAKDTGQTVKRLPPVREWEGSFNEQAFQPSLDGQSNLVTLARGDMSCIVSLVDYSVQRSNREAERPVEAWLADLKGRDRQARVRAERFLRDARSNENGTTALLAAARNRKVSPDTRAVAVKRLGESCGRSILPSLLPLITDRYPQVRLAVVQQIGALGDDTRLSSLVPALDDLNFDVRRSAVRAIVLVGGVSARTHLQKILADVDSPLRGEAAVALFMAGDDSMLPVVKDYTNQEDMEENGSPTLLFIALCKAGDPEALSMLKEKMGQEQHWGWHVVATELIGKYAAERRFIPFLVEAGRLVRNDYPDDRIPLTKNVATALGNIGDLTAIPFLLELLPDWRRYGGSDHAYEGYERNAVTTALENLSGQSFGNNKGWWQMWWTTVGKNKLVNNKP